MSCNCFHIPLSIINTNKPNSGMNECLMTPQHKKKSAIGCQINGNLKANMYISKKIKS